MADMLGVRGGGVEAGKNLRWAFTPFRFAWPFFLSCAQLTMEPANLQQEQVQEAQQQSLQEQQILQQQLEEEQVPQQQLQQQQVPEQQLPIQEEQVPQQQLQQQQVPQQQEQQQQQQQRNPNRRRRRRRNDSPANWQQPANFYFPIPPPPLPPMPFPSGFGPWPVLRNVTNLNGFPYHPPPHVPAPYILPPPPPPPVLTPLSRVPINAFVGNGGQHGHFGQNIRMDLPSIGRGVGFHQQRWIPPAPPNDPRINRRRRMPPPVPLDEVIADRFYHAQNPPTKDWVPASKDVELKTTVWEGTDSADLHDRRCAVCLQDLVVGESVSKTIKCNGCAAIHTDCLVNWLSKQGNCPLCRKRAKEEGNCAKEAKEERHGGGGNGNGGDGGDGGSGNGEGTSAIM